MSDLFHEGADCYKPCGGESGPCPTFCGQRGLCCSKGNPDPAVGCDGLAGGEDDKYICIEDPEADLDSLGERCNDACKGDSHESGVCDFCGAKALCCKRDDPLAVPECKGLGNDVDHFTCVQRPELELGKLCEESCRIPGGIFGGGSEPSGICGFCGYKDGRHALCCKKNDPNPAPECLGLGGVTAVPTTYSVNV